MLAEGQKIPMRIDGNYYYGELFFESPGTYVYSIEIDTGHGKLKSYEQNIIVSQKQSDVVSESDETALPSLNIISIIFVIIILSSRKR